MKNQALFTASWNDGDLLDTCMTELLSRHGFQIQPGALQDLDVGRVEMPRERPRRVSEWLTPPWGAMSGF